MAGHRPAARHHHRLEAGIQPYQQGGLMDRLIEAIEAKQNPSVVGLDPTEALVPEQSLYEASRRRSRIQVEDMSGGAGQRIRRLLREFQPCHHRRPRGPTSTGGQTADRHVRGTRPRRYRRLPMTCEYAKQQGLYVLGDVKRGDIGSTTAAYAHHPSGIGTGGDAFDLA